MEIGWRRVMRARSSQRRATPLWLWPAISGVVAIVTVEALARTASARNASWASWWVPGDTSSASTMIQAVATSAITVTGLTFSVTVVALQLASQQFSPRLLREFTRDPVTRVVLSVLVATFTACLTALRHLRNDESPPSLVVTLVFVLGLLSMTAVLGFISHIVRVLRVDSMMSAVHDETSQAIKAFYPVHSDDSGTTRADDVPDGPGHVLLARSSGFVRSVDVPVLVQAARQAGGLVRVDVRPGDHVVQGTLLASMWADDPDQLEPVVHRAVVIAFERTLEQDAAFGFRQLEDIAVKALSPGINDPVTAAHAVGHMSDLLVRLTACRLGPTSHEDEVGTIRAVIPDRDFRYYLELSCAELRRYATKEPTVLCALLRMLRDVAASTRDDEQRAEIARQAELVAQSASSGLLEDDITSITSMHARVHQALAGDVLTAYADRAGETRSV